MLTGSEASFSPYGGIAAGRQNSSADNAIARRAPPSSNDYQKGLSFSAILGHSIATNTIMCLLYSSNKWASVDSDDSNYHLTEIGLGIVQYIMPENLFISAFIVSTDAEERSPNVIETVVGGIGIRFIAGREWRILRGAFIGVGGHFLWASNAAAWGLTVSAGYDYKK